MKIFGERLKEIRDERGVSMSELARQMKTSHQNISRWESGEIVPGGETLVKLANFLKVSADYLLGIRNDY